jgi:hypothetical protein
MNNNDKSFEEIGKLLFQIIDYIEGGYKKQNAKQQKRDIHYLKQLTREPSPAVKLGWTLKDKIMTHPKIKGSVSEEMVNAELLSLLQIDKKMRTIRELNPEKIGRSIINSLCAQKSAKLVAFPLQGFFPSDEISKIGNTEFGFLRTILSHHKIAKPQLTESNKLHISETDEVINDVNGYVTERLKTLCVGTVVTAGDKKSSIHMAEKQINLVLNIVRLLIPLDYGVSKRPRISFYDLVGIDEGVMIDLISGEKEFVRQFLSSLYPFIPNISRYRVEKSFDKASNIVCKQLSERHDLEERVLKAINWAGEGIDAIEKDIKVVKCVVALEVLFRLKDIGKQKQFVDEVSRIFDSNNINKDLIKKRAKDIYELRSKIVHRGKRDITDEEAEWAERLACGCILGVLENMATE